ncbi:PREDICTED: cinnamoyl-CoA reductase 1-like [Tarenaya hassleriana]|uniref:cinnamoyl-CoA reductase 1-like n=1 Tax=Tarenaya hassleriana TaxID=28532 RepID=UPI0008FD6A75|nr:PREDICTED: cinnamoyl-CoA reductase 1-like [Tarenaya hassleriana]
MDRELQNEDTHYEKERALDATNSKKEGIEKDMIVNDPTVEEMNSEEEASHASDIIPLPTLTKNLSISFTWRGNQQQIHSIIQKSSIAPLLQPTLNTSAAAIANLIKGSKAFPNSSYGWVNVKDVANAHVMSFENPSASGRYCLVESVAHYSEIVSILRQLYPNLHLPRKCADENPYVPTYQVSKERVKSLGIDYVPLKVSIMETVESLKEKGFVHF